MNEFDKEAEAKYVEEMENCRKLKETDPDVYLPRLANMLKNLAILQSRNVRFNEAEDNYTEALGIYQKLTETNPDEYLTDAAYTLTLENLIEIKEKLSKTDEAEELKKKLAEIKKEAKK